MALLPENPSISKVLFVDDDPQILSALLNDLGEAEFDLFMAHSAAEGMDILKKDRMDVVVSDVEMPEQNGIDFLVEVKERYPNIHRVLLHEAREHDRVTQAITRGFATAHLTKPWQGPELQNKIDHILKVRKTLKQEKLLESINEIEQLPSLPTLYQEFSQAVFNEKPVKEIAKIIEGDVSLSARLLQIGNSAFYGTVSITSTEMAIMRLGLKAVKDLVLTFSFVSEMNWTPGQLELLQSVFNHSSMVNRFVKKVFNLRNGKPMNPEMASIGLLHDIGKVIMLQYFPERYEAIVEHQKQHPGSTFYESETELGFTWFRHEDVGGYFLHMWNLPDSALEAALFHHQPDKADAPHRDFVEALAFTNDLVNQLELKMAGKKEAPSGLMEDFLAQGDLHDLSSEIERAMEEELARKS
jgi:HD-like signal output (HDOD) protein